MNDYDKRIERMKEIEHKALIEYIDNRTISLSEVILQSDLSKDTKREYFILLDD